MKCPGNSARLGMDSKRRAETRMEEEDRCLHRMK